MHRPLGSYLVLMSTYGTLVGGSLAALRAAGKELPERVDPVDVALVGLATQKVARLIAKDKVTAPLRAPFTEDTGDAGQGEVHQEPKDDHPLQFAVGELLECPYCLGTWVAGGFSVGLVAAPRLTRFVAGVFAAQAIADRVQLDYAAAREQL